MANDTSRQEKFIKLLDEYNGLIAKVCYVYSSPIATMDDLYQEVAANIWTGLDRFRGESKISTWIYRTAINTCITCMRRNRNHSLQTGIDAAMLVADDGAEAEERMAQYRMLHNMIAALQPMEKAIVTMWLDDKPYAEIADVTGLSVANVATRLHRIKEKLAKNAEKHEPTR
jgi:RNA polymerase sigma-70 factor (ECF subfamily)